MDKGRISLSSSVLNFPVSTDGKKYGEGEEEESEKLLKESHREMTQCMLRAEEADPSLKEAHGYLRTFRCLP